MHSSLRFFYYPASADKGQRTEDRLRLRLTFDFRPSRLVPGTSVLLLAFDAHCNTHAAADAERGEALLGIALLHLVEQRHQHASAGGADRMTDRDRAAVDVDLRRIPAEVLVDGASLRCERLVRFDQIEIADVPARLLERCTRSRDRPGPHDCGVDARMGPGHDPCERRLAALGRLARRHQHDGGSAIIDPGCVGRGDGAVLAERRPQLADPIERGPVLGILVGVDDHVALAGLHRDRGDLILEFSRLLRRLGLVLRPDRKLVLLRPGDLPLARHVLGGVAHVVAVEGIPETVLDHGIDHLEIAHLHAAAQMRAVRRLAHGFLAAGHHDLGIAVEDGLVAERHRAQAGTAELVDAPGRALDRDSRRDRSLAGRVLALTGGENLTQNDLGHLCAFDAGALEGLLDGHLSQFVGRQRRKRPAEGADRRARRTDDDNIVLHLVTPFHIGWTATVTRLPADYRLLATPA